MTVVKYSNINSNETNTENKKKKKKKKKKGKNIQTYYSKENVVKKCVYFPWKWSKKIHYGPKMNVFFFTIYNLIYMYFKF